MRLELLPWHAGQWAHLRAARAQGRLAHALLLGGPAGTGRGHFARMLAASLLCPTPVSEDGSACGECASCRQFAAGSHADLFHAAPPEAGKALGVDRIRALIDSLHLTAGGENKVGLIDPADALTRSAANSLLKTLEEPPDGAYLLLVSARSGNLPATIRSRCQRVPFGMPDADQALAWLQQQHVSTPENWLARAGGAPLLARELAMTGEGADSAAPDPVSALLAVMTRRRSPVGAAAALAASSLGDSVRAWIITVEDMLRLQHAPGAALRLPARREELLAAAAQVDAVRLFDYLESLYRSIPGPSSSLREPMQIQGLLADAAQINAGRPAATTR